MLPIEEFKLKIYIICIFVGNENAEQSSFTIPCREEYFQKKKQRYIHKGDNDDADNNDNNERPHLFIFHISSIREIKFYDISLTESVTCQML